MLLVLLITFNFHCYVWGCLCETNPFQFRWLKNISIAHVIIIIKSEVSILPIVIIFSVAVFLRCLLHRVLSFIAYTFRENRDFVFIIIVQFMMNANSRIRFGLQIVLICLYTTPSHCHHWANLSEDIGLLNSCQIYFVECVSKIDHIRSVIHYTISIYGAVCFQFTNFPCDDWENIYFVLLSSSNRKYELSSIVWG